MEPKRIEWNPKNIYRLKPLKNWKLYTTIIIMLKNIIYGKAAARLVNTFNSEIVVVLTP